MNTTPMDIVPSGNAPKFAPKPTARDSALFTRSDIVNALDAVMATTVNTDERRPLVILGMIFGLEIR